MQTHGLDRSSPVRPSLCLWLADACRWLTGQIRKPHTATMLEITPLPSISEGNLHPTDVEIDIPKREGRKMDSLHQGLTRPSSSGWHIFSSALCVAFVAHWMITQNHSKDEATSACARNSGKVQRGRRIPELKVDRRKCINAVWVFSGSNTELRCVFSRVNWIEVLFDHFRM